MPVWKWPKVTLRGEGQVIPHVCPNCLAPGLIHCRYDYSPPFFIWLFTRASYYQTFFYCPGCAGLLAAQDRIWGVFRWYLPVGIVVFTLLLIALERLGVSSNTAGSAVAVLVVVPYFLIFGWLRWQARVQYPLRADQVTWGRAAYCTGPGWVPALFGPSRAVYRAAQPEWLKRLVEANPEQVDNETYQRVVGMPKPIVEQKRPFFG